jgi:carbonic anhydrase/acetyltransferase-like protein (isoleucine patch superfamily)
VHPGAWLAPGCVVVGDVEIGEDSSVWYAAVLRGDVASIRIGARTNLQDGCVVHVTADRFSTSIGDDVTVGHRGVVHGCIIEDGALIGIGAIVLDGARVGAGALIGAGAVVTPGTQIESRGLALGAPARVVRTLTDEEFELQLERTRRYVDAARIHAQSGELDS